MAWLSVNAACRCSSHLLLLVFRSSTDSERRRAERVVVADARKRRQENVRENSHVYRGRRRRAASRGVAQPELATASALFEKPGEAVQKEYLQPCLSRLYSLLDITRPRLVHLRAQAWPYLGTTRPAWSEAAQQLAEATEAEHAAYQ
jgi:hypothetical protein